MASPHTRGWTRSEPVTATTVTGFPAHAGMDPAGIDGGAVDGGLPRTRGDGPLAGLEVLWREAASPHTRGWTRQRRRPSRRMLGFPAHAGMDPAASRRRYRRRWLPRTRGDGPWTSSTLRWVAEASPHTRGWTLDVVDAAMGRRGFPAHAGMDRAPTGRSGASGGLPRTRGDGPRAMPAVTSEITASPHTRGWTPPLSLRQEAGRMASPHTRGWTQSTSVWSRGGGGFPAHAGMDPDDGCPVSAAGGLPRTRGDGPWTSSTLRWVAEASPHTRGWTVYEVRPYAGVGGFPAHAGMDPSPGASVRATPGLPRTRGDGPRHGRLWSGWPRASPHTRGWTCRQPHSCARCTGFPAHAGMDLDPTAGGALPQRLPRTRGDGPSRSPLLTGVPVASPHTRGWTVLPGVR